MLASPSATSSWLESVSYANFIAKVRTIDMERMNEKMPTTRAGWSKSNINSMLRVGIRGCGRPEGTSPTTGRLNGESSRCAPTHHTRKVARTRRSSCSGSATLGQYFLFNTLA